MIDDFHLKAYNIQAINYNRDLESFPVLNTILNKITGTSIYKSPTDMGVNVVAKCITDDAVCREAGKQELIRRYLKARVDYKKGLCNKATIERTFDIMRKCGLTVEDRFVYRIAHQTSQEKNCHIVAIELSDGRIVTGKSQGLITATAGAVLNALKELADIPHDNIVNREAVINISELKQTLKLGSSLDLKEIFMALSIFSSQDESTAKALAQISKLKDCEVHSTYVIPTADEDFLRKLKVNLTCDDIFASNQLFI
jgi:uncharacterized protein (UPF0371 family)